jgi:hypothetical protein
MCPPAFGEESDHVIDLCSHRAAGRHVDQIAGVPAACRSHRQCTVRTWCEHLDIGAAARNAGTSSARTREDLPEPDGPVTTSAHLPQACRYRRDK